MLNGFDCGKHAEKPEDKTAPRHRKRGENGRPSATCVRSISMKRANPVSPGAMYWGWEA